MPGLHGRELLRQGVNTISFESMWHATPYLPYSQLRKTILWADVVLVNSMSCHFWQALLYIDNTDFSDSWQIHFVSDLSLVPGVVDDTKPSQVANNWVPSAWRSTFAAESRCVCIRFEHCKQISQALFTELFT